MKIIYDEQFFYKNILNLDSMDELNKMPDPIQQYNQFNLKKHGKERTIYGIKPKTKLYSLQKKLLKNFLEDIPLPNCVCGFVKEHSYLDFLKVHCGKKYFLRVDIKDFFNSIKSSQIISSLDEYIQISDELIKNKINQDILNIVTFKDELPQGAVTSPQLANIFFRRIDLRIRKYCRKLNIEYTRYADDLLFSSNDLKIHKDYFLSKIRLILRDYNLELNNKKLVKAKEKIILNGYVIEDKVRLSRNKLKKIKSFIYAFNYKGNKKNISKNIEEYTYRLASLKGYDYYTSDDLYINYSRIINYLAGYRSYLISFSKPTMEDSCEAREDIISEIEEILDRLSIEKLNYNKNRENIVIMIKEYKFGRVTGHLIELRKIKGRNFKTKIFYEKILKMKKYDKSLLVKFNNGVLNKDKIISEIESKSLASDEIRTNINELKYAININFIKNSVYYLKGL